MSCFLLLPAPSKPHTPSEISHSVNPICLSSLPSPVLYSWIWINHELVDQVCGEFHVCPLLCSSFLIILNLSSWLRQKSDSSSVCLCKTVVPARNVSESQSHFECAAAEEETRIHISLNGCVLNIIMILFLLCFSFLAVMWTRSIVATPPFSFKEHFQRPFEQELWKLWNVSF